jgi:1-acyl-sn-glycerol-3-phosphate acyltransferase
VRARYRVAWTLLLGVARLLWGFRRTGTDRIPATGPAIIACNHVSYWDPILVGLGCRREVHFMAKEELFRNRFFGWLIRSYNALPVRRGVMDRKALRAASDVLKSGNVLLMFPEGGRNDGGEVGDAKSGVGFIACMNQAPVVPAYIAGSSTLARAFLRRSPAVVTFGRPIPAAKAESSEDYRALSAKVAEEIGRLKQEVDGR